MRRLIPEIENILTRPVRRGEKRDLRALASAIRKHYPRDENIQLLALMFEGSHRIPFRLEPHEKTPGRRFGSREERERKRCKKKKK